jgi:citrate lyase beta subunit
MAALDDAYAQGKAAITFDGRMVDIAHYKKAQSLVARSECIAAYEERKRKARETML